MQVTDLHTDIETYSSVSIKDAGAYKYLESIDFEILMVAYSFDKVNFKIVDLAQGEDLPEEFTKALLDPTVRKHAHNAVFERRAFEAYGYQTHPRDWHCSAIKASYCGFPLSLGAISEAMGLGDKAKDKAGKALIQYFCVPVKPTKTNGHRTRNFPHHDLEKWEQFKNYCIQDVVAECAIGDRLDRYEIPEDERTNYILDQEINDRGILVDLTMAANAVEMDGINSDLLTKELQELTGLDNPNSPAQLKAWLGRALKKEIKSLAKEPVKELIAEAAANLKKAEEDETSKYSQYNLDIAYDVVRVLDLRVKAAKTSVKKYIKMLECACDDNRAHGLLQFYGARTGRWAGRLVQLQNLPQNHLDDEGELEAAKEMVVNNDFDGLGMVYDDVASVLSQLIRTTFIAPKGKTFAVADFSAIEARVIAWLADEKWRLDVFKTTGKIYEASAAMMFDVPIEEVTKGSDLRAKGKVAELALGYQGALGALKAMGGEKMGLSDFEMESIVKRWRKASPAIVKLWANVEAAAMRAVQTRKPVTCKNKGLVFQMEGKALTILLPSGRKLFYQGARIGTNRFGRESIEYYGTHQVMRKWMHLETYGGKLTENIIQAIARDLLAVSMQRLDEEGYPIVMHVHDEAICEVLLEDQEQSLEDMCEIMGQTVDWAPGLPLVADGYLTPFYKKD